jgi:hypothetical protein
MYSSIYTKTVNSPKIWTETAFPKLPIFVLNIKGENLFIPIFCKTLKVERERV